MTRAVLAIAIVVGLAGGLAGSAGAQPTFREPPAGQREREVSSAPPPGAPPDRRPFYVAGGVLVLAALFLLNRRHRAELERTSEAETRRLREQARAARAPADEPAGEPAEADAPDDDDPDAADLRAAASGEPKDAPP